jgi:hypothetical protein
MYPLKILSKITSEQIYSFSKVSNLLNVLISEDLLHSKNE